MDESAQKSATGVLLAESIRAGSVLDGLPLTVEKIERADVGDTSVGQPLTWSFLHFRVPVDEVEALANRLSDVLEENLGWYCDFRTPEETFVVFAGRVFRYPRGDNAGRASAEAHARSMGVPESQIDWPE